jgi:hypothetical protein
MATAEIFLMNPCHILFGSTSATLVTLFNGDGRGSRGSQFTNNHMDVGREREQFFKQLIVDEAACFLSFQYTRRAKYPNQRVIEGKMTMVSS